MKNLILSIAALSLLLSCAKKEDPSAAKNTSEQVTDISGNTYNTVTIGNQVWFTTNLKATKYSNGDPIDLAATTSGIYTNYANYTQNSTYLEKGVYSMPYYNKDSASIQGYTYNFFAARDPRNICPTGFHVPTDTEWKLMLLTIGAQTIAGSNQTTGYTKYFGANTIKDPSWGGLTGLAGSGLNIKKTGTISFTNGLIYTAYKAFFWGSTYTTSYSQTGNFVSKGGFSFSIGDTETSTYPIQNTASMLCIRCLKN